MYVEEPCTCHRNSQSPKRRWLLTDFGISGILGPQSVGYTTLGRHAPLYCAPELYLVPGYEEKGDAKPYVFTRQFDIWSIGCLLFYLATGGKHAFRDELEVANFGKPILKSTIPQLSAAESDSDGSTLNCETFSSETQRRAPVWEQLNSIVAICLVANPLERATTMRLKVRLEEMKENIGYER